MLSPGGKTSATPSKLQFDRSTAAPPGLWISMNSSASFPELGWYMISEITT